MICVDSSVAAKWFLQEEWTEQARALYFATLSAGEWIVAPPLLPIEVTNIVRKRLRTVAAISLEEATLQLERFLSFPIEIRNPAGLHRRALVIADRFGLPAAYDAHYLALAEQLDCQLWTADRRLVRAVASAMPLVRFIGEYDRGSA
jgi:predicted nucleic acid-binding protein